MEELTVQELMALAKEKGIDVPAYSNGKPKMSKTELIAFIEAGGDKKPVVFSRPAPVSKSRRFRRRRY